MNPAGNYVGHFICFGPEKQRREERRREERRGEQSRGEERREMKRHISRPKSKWEDNINIYVNRNFE
jgi:hypothetical protein